MEIRKATSADIKTLTHKLQNKRIEYNTIEMMKKDVKESFLWVLIDNNTIVASCAVVSTEFDWLGVKRLVVYNKKNCGKGYAGKLLKAVTATPQAYCITPWDDNEPMKHLAEKVGFSFKYKFNGNWCCYLKNA